MDPAFEKKYHAFEDQYWWFRARRDSILRLIARLHIPASANILEIGCSTGPLLQLLKIKGFQNLTGIDISPVAIERCKMRGLSDVHVMDATAPQFDNRQFDLIIAADVLEHIEPADKALANWAALLRPGGKLLVFVPAFMCLWSEHDSINRHFRRYIAAELQRDLQHAGFHVLRTSYWNTLLFPPVAAIRLAKRLLTKPTNHGKDQLIALIPLVNFALEKLVIVENRLMAAGLRLPIGVSVMALAEKP